jgi:hypothetical protein
MYRSREVVWFCGNSPHCPRVLRTVSLQVDDSTVGKEQRKLARAHVLSLLLISTYYY